MTNESEDNSFSRKGFLKLDWLKKQSGINEKDDLTRSASYVRISIDLLKRLSIGTALKINDMSDIYAIRISEGIIFLSSLCP